MKAHSLRFDMLILAFPILFLHAMGTVGCDPGNIEGGVDVAQDVPAPQESSFRTSMLIPEGMDFSIVQIQAYEAPESGEPNPAVDPLVGEDSSEVNPLIPVVTVDLLLAPGRYYLLVTFLKPDGTPSDDCGPQLSDVFEVVPHEQTEVQFTVQCAPATGKGPVEVGFEFADPTVFLTDVEQDYHWNVCGGVTRIVATAEDLAGLDFWFRLNVTGTPELEPGSFFSVQEVGFGEYLLHANQPGTYNFRLEVVNELGAFDYINATVVFQGDASCNDEVLACEGATPIDLTRDLPMPFDTYACPDALVEATNAEQGLIIEGCGEAVTVVSSDAAQMLVVLREDFAGGMNPDGCIAWSDTGVGVVTFDTEVGTRYLVVAEQAGYGFQTELTRTGCCQ